MSSEELSPQPRRARFTLDENSIAHLQSVLSNLYTDREAAIIRELSVNGYDAQIAAGRGDEPVRITLPDRNNQHVLTISDCGVGMSENELFDLYSKYGASTKRDGDGAGQTGMLGLGSKAPLALVDKFTVTSVKDGVSTVAVVEKDSDGVAALTVAESFPTGERSGTTIRIPVTSFNSFAEKANQLFRYWPEGSVLVNGCAPERVKGDRLGDVFTLVQGESTDYVVMGNVPYPVHIPSTYRSAEGLLPGRSWRRPFGLVANIPLGSVHFTPSRESLNYTPATIKFLENLRGQFIEALIERIVDEVNLATTKTDALKTLVTWRRRALGVNLPDTWWGEKIPSLFTVPRTVWSDVMPGDPQGRQRRSSTSVVTRMDADEVFSSLTVDTVTSVFVTGWGPVDRKLTPTVKAKTRQLLIQNGYTQVRHVHYAPDFSGAGGWFDGVPTFTLDTVNQVKLPRVKKPRAKAAVRKWRVWNDNSSTYEQLSSAEFADKGKVVYASPPDLVYGYRKREASPYTVAQIAGTDTAFVLVNANQWKTFLRENPKAVHFHKWRDEVAAQHMSNVTDRDLAHHYLNRNHVTRLLDADKILDPSLAEWTRMVHEIRDTKHVSDFEKKVEQLESIGAETVWPEWTTVDPLERYVLLKHAGGWNTGEDLPNHMLTYVNALWKERN